MTVIVAVTDGEIVVMGADRAYSNSQIRTEGAYGKIEHVGDLLIGVAGDARTMDVVMSMPPVDAPVAQRTWMVRTYVPLLIAELEAARCLRKRDECAEMNGAEILIGVGGRLFTIQNDLSVIDHLENYAAIGAGESLALGALAATPDVPLTERVSLALSVVREHSPWVGNKSSMIVLEAQA